MALPVSLPAPLCLLARPLPGLYSKPLNTPQLFPFSGAPFLVSGPQPPDNPNGNRCIPAVYTYPPSDKVSTDEFELLQCKMCVCVYVCVFVCKHAYACTHL
jgi:hypothetical protein